MIAPRNDHLMHNPPLAADPRARTYHTRQHVKPPTQPDNAPLDVHALPGANASIRTLFDAVRHCLPAARPPARSSVAAPCPFLCLTPSSWRTP